jgi:hypothetical protein
MAAGVPRNHHWVPQCYLKGFAKSRSKNAQLHVIDAVAQRHFTTVPRNVASARDFNRVEIDGVDPNRVEMDMAQFEGAVDKALERICRDRDILDAEDRNLVLNLIALLSVRTPSMREHIRQGYEQVLKRVMDLTLATKERYEASFASAAQAGAFDGEDMLPYETMRDFFDRDQYTITMPTTRHVRQEFDLVDTILPLLGRRNWLIVRAEPGTGGFITSDHPVILKWTEQRDRGLFHSPGFGLRGTEVIFTISHDLAIIGTFDDPPGTMDAGVREVALINGCIIGHNRRQIYARDDRFYYTVRDGKIHRGIDVLCDLPRPRSAHGKP